MACSQLVVGSVDGGWALCWEGEDGKLTPASHPWDDKKLAQQFLKIARPEWGFIPSKLS